MKSKISILVDLDYLESMANFEVFHWVISSSMNFSFMKSGSTYCHLCKDGIMTFLSHSGKKGD